jgi:magnesium-transporting ATPase (P-type)
MSMMNRFKRAQSTQYPSNKISSTKYSLWSFFPLALFQQLKNAIHLDHLIKGVFNSIPRFSTNSPLASFVPTLWVMLLNMLYELFADLKKWRQDRKINAHPVKKVSLNKGEVVVQDSRSDDLYVGDIIKLENDDMVMADCLILSTGNYIGRCYISTEQLDGEANLKPKLAPTVTQGKLAENSN